LRKLLNPNVIRLIATADRATPGASILTAGLAVAGLRRKLSSRIAPAWTMSRPNASRQLIVATKPTMTNARTPAIARAEPSQPTASACCLPR